LDHRVLLNFEEIINEYRNLVGISEGKRLLGRHGKTLLERWQKKWSKKVDWVHMAQDREKMQAFVNRAVDIRRNISTS
jgi:hypothetical protein